MSPSTRLKDVLAPIASVLSAISCGFTGKSGSRTEFKVEPSSITIEVNTESTTLSSPSSTTSSPKPSRPLDRSSLAASSTLQKAALQRHVSPPSPSSSPVYRVVTLPELLYLIFGHMDNVSLSRCATRVCRLWFYIATDVQWRDALATSMDPMLCFFDLFSYSWQLDPVYHRRPIWISVPPSAANWRTFEARAGAYIHYLTINLTSLYTSHQGIERLKESAPNIRLPKLKNLRIVVNQMSDELEFVQAFMQPTVKTFVLEIWEPVVGYHRATACMQREGKACAPSFSGTFPGAPLDTLLTAVGNSMPEITDLSLTMRDLNEISRAWPAFTALARKLQNLHTLRLPRCALSLSVILSLASHPNLSRLVMYDKPDGTPAPSQPYREILDLENADLEVKWGLLHHITALVVTTSPPELQGMVDVSEPLNLTVLHVYLCAFFTGAVEVNEFVAAIAGACPALEDLKICPMTVDQERGLPVRTSFRMVHPLRRCRKLRSVEIISPLTSQFTDRQFTRLVSAWPSLERLILDHPHVGVSKPQERARLSLQGAFSAFRKHCPELRMFFLHVSPTAKTHHYPRLGETRHTEIILTNLEEAHLCLSYPPEGATPGQFSRMLQLQLPLTCCVQLHITPRAILGVMDTYVCQTEWMRRWRVLKAFASRVASVKVHIPPYPESGLL